MFQTRIKLFVLVALILTLAGSAAVSQQDGGKGKGKGGFGGMDPESQFKQYSGGKDVITISEVEAPQWMSRFLNVTSEQLREKMRAYLQKKGVTNGRMTMEQFRDYSDEARREMMEKASGMLKGGGVGGAPGSTQSGGGGAPGGGAPGGGDVDGKAKGFFEMLDADKDGFLTVEEVKANRMGGRLAESFEQHDTNKDKKIDLKEYTEYLRARMGGSRDDKGGEKDKDKDKGKSRVEFEEDDRPKQIEEKRVVYKIGSLPPELKTSAPWFEEIDKDKDAQIGLYEWRAAGKNVEEFLAMDANGDGFATIEEIFRYRKAVEGKKSVGPSAVASLPGAGGMQGMMQQWGGKGGGKGNFGGKGGGKGGMPNIGGGGLPNMGGGAFPNMGGGADKGKGKKGKR